MKKIFLAIICYFALLTASAQDQYNPRSERPFSFKAGLTADDFSPILNFKASYFKSYKTEFVAEAGLSSYFNLGMNFHFTGPDSNSPFSPYFGMRAGSINEEFVFSFPVGLNCILPSGLTFTAALVPTWDFPYGDLDTYIDFSIGWSFHR